MIQTNIKRRYFTAQRNIERRNTLTLNYIYKTKLPFSSSFIVIKRQEKENTSLQKTIQ